ncbi:unnamed protein product [Blepharisma stoltei]|uniref:protein-tyrosine-phosphatase n=1 Tax=Blepharisma stoltei TaxID=1481888 RepID=A0AAU9IE54_9CILI|nr:unnamed protein product [Blepharisma stoltei]
MVDLDEANNYFGFYYEPMHEIEQGLYLGCMRAAECEELLRAHNIKYIVQALESQYTERFDWITYHFVEIWDNPYQDLAKHLPSALQFIHQHLSAGENVLVHCAAGISRSSSIVIAYLMGKHLIDFYQAFDRVSSKRSCVSPNFGFRKQLKDTGEQQLRTYLILP